MIKILLLHIGIKMLFLHYTNIIIIILIPGLQQPRRADTLIKLQERSEVEGSTDVATSVHLRASAGFELGSRGREPEESHRTQRETPWVWQEQVDIIIFYNHF